MNPTITATTPTGPPIRNGAPQHHWGFGNMPAVEDITDDQIKQVIAYIRTQQQELGFEQ